MNFSRESFKRVVEDCTENSLENHKTSKREREQKVLNIKKIYPPLNGLSLFLTEKAYRRFKSTLKSLAFPHGKKKLLRHANGSWNTKCTFFNIDISTHLTWRPLHKNSNEVRKWQYKNSIQTHNKWAQIWSSISLFLTRGWEKTTRKTGMLDQSSNFIK